MVIVVMGVSGSGKSTVGRDLAERLGGQFHDGDDFHPPRNVEKMRSGTPLTEADRVPWLQAMAAKIEGWLSSSQCHVLACSALTRKSRRSLGVPRDRVHLVYLRGSFELIHDRMSKREHFMPPELLRSQFETLEPPEQALTLDVEESPEMLVERVARALGETP